MAKSNYVMCRDRQGRTCLKVSEYDGGVSYIPMPLESGFQIEFTSNVSFDQRYKPMPKYPIDKACQLYLNYAVILGCSSEVLDYLSTEITISKEDREMAEAKFSNPPPPGIKKAPAKKAPAKKAPAKKAPAKKAPAKKNSPPWESEYKSAAAMFQALIMEGGIPDDEIFSQVQTAFGLDNKKRSYVTWYRNKLKKDGQSPPEAV